MNVLFTFLYSLFLAFAGSCISEPLCERVVVNLQLCNLQRQAVQKMTLLNMYSRN
jgi:hypothetical protein